MTLPAPAYRYLAEVIAVHDADTITVRIDLGCHVARTEHLRLLGLNAPELATPAGQAARDWLAHRLPPTTPVLVETVKDRTEKYGRLLATVTDAAGDVNAALLAAGHAVPYDGGRR